MTIYKYIFSNKKVSVSKFNIYKFNDSIDADLHLYVTYYPNMANDIPCDIVNFNSYKYKLLTNKGYSCNDDIIVYTIVKLDFGADITGDIELKDFIKAIDKYCESDPHITFIREWSHLVDNSRKKVLYGYTMITRFKDSIFELLDFTKDIYDIKYENMRYVYIKNQNDKKGSRLDEICKSTDPTNYFYANEIYMPEFTETLYNGLINYSIQNTDSKYSTIDHLKTFRFYSKENIDLNIFSQKIIGSINKKSILLSGAQLDEEIKQKERQIKELERQISGYKNKQAQLKNNLIKLSLK